MSMLSQVGRTMKINQQAYEAYQKILNDHREIIRLLTVTFRVLVERQRTAEQLSELLGSLHERLRSHFEDEEASHMFGQLAEAVPWLAESAYHLRDEHQGLLLDLGGLRDRCRCQQLTHANWDELEAGFRRFSDRLGEHENTENNLLLEAYGDDLGTGD